MVQTTYAREQPTQDAYDQLIDEMAATVRSRDGSLAGTVNDVMDAVLHTSPDPLMDAAILACGHNDPDKREARKHYIDSNNPTADERRFGYARTVVFADVADRV